MTTLATQVKKLEMNDKNKSFEGAVAIVTGASRGIGKALAVELGRQGASVVCAARATNENRFKLEGTIDETVELIEKEGGEALAVPTDLSSPEAVEAMVEAAAKNFGGLDILVNNAAVTFPGDIDIQPKHYELIMDINVRAPLLASAYSRPHLTKSQHGRILNVSSVTSLLYAPHMMVYGMSKAALDHLSVSTAAQFVEDGICVNCFRIDVPVASEGYLMNAPDEDHSTWFSPEAAALTMCWMLSQPPDYTGKIEDMMELGMKLKTLGDIEGKGPIETDWRINP